MNFVPCLTWVKSGVAKATPEKLQLSQEELKRLIEETKADIKDTLVDEDETEDSEHEGEERRESEDMEQMDNAEAANTGDEDGDINARYNLDDYDDDESEMNPIFNIAGLTLYADSKDDPYITVPDEEDEKEEIQDFNIQPTDNLLVVGHVESDSSILEVYVYNQEEDDLYVHHDIVLPAYPLAVEWLDFHPSENSPGNYIAVSDMTPVINIWDLDVVDILEPYYKLGEKPKKKKKAKKACAMYSGHTDAVLDLSWNRNVRNVLASGSADRTICLWDLQEAKCMLQMAHHNDKVQSLKWNPSESEILLSGGCDGLVNLCDCRTPESILRQWSVTGEVEKVLWNHLNTSYAFCSTDSGSVHCIDTRVDKIAYSIKAHNGAVMGLDLSFLQAGCLVTAGSDRCFKVWDVNNEPKFIASKKMKLGSLYVAKSNPDYPFTFAFGGDNQSLNLKVVNLMDIEECSEYFGKSSINSVKIQTQEAVTVTSSSSAVVPAMNQQNIKSENDHEMDTDLNDSHASVNSSVSLPSHNTSSSSVKKSKRKNRFKNKKKFV